MADYRFQDRALTADQSDLVDAIIAGLPTLTGTHKQVSWAQALRTEIVITTVVHGMGSKAQDPAIREQALTSFADPVKAAKIHVAQASRWIDAFGARKHSLPNLFHILSSKIAL